MLNVYKRNFILSNLLLTGTALFLMLSAVFAYSYHIRLMDLKRTMAQFTEPFDSGPHRLEPPAHAKPQDSSSAPSSAADSTPPAKPQNPAGESASVKKAPKSLDTQNRKYGKTIAVFFYHTDTGEISFLANPLITDADTVKRILKKISASPDSFGRLAEENFYFYQTSAHDLTKIALADTRTIRNASIEMLCVLFLVFVCTMLLFYLISRHLAQAAVRPLEASLRLEKQFIADTSHDLKTPVAVILANTGILRRSQTSPVSELMQWVEGTETAARSMQALIEEMLMISSIEAADPAIPMETVNLSDTAEGISLLLEPIAYEKQISFSTDITEHICIQANEEYIKRIFQSLIENAIKYEPEDGSITVRLSIQHKKAVFLVNNRLATIEPDDLPHVFDKFYRSDKARHRNDGHGLGLAIARRMTERMHGAIEAESSAETGTTFRVIFKL